MHTAWLPFLAAFGHTPPEPPQHQPRQDDRNARTTEAYARPPRPRHHNKRGVVSVAAILLIVISAAATGCGSTTTPKAGDETSASPKAQADKPAAEAPPATAGPTSKLPIQNGDWSLLLVDVNDDGRGDFTGTAHVLYTGGGPEAASNFFTLTVFVRGKGVAALHGSAHEVVPGHAATVRFVSQDKFVRGPYKYDFESDQ